MLEDDDTVKAARAVLRNLDRNQLQEVLALALDLLGASQGACVPNKRVPVLVRH